VSNSPLPEGGKVVDLRTDLLSQRAAFKTEHPQKIEKQIMNCNLAQTMERAVEHNLPQRKGAGQRNKHPALNSQ
jgi:hypothetical protein